MIARTRGALLGVFVGPHNDGRFETVGALIGHIFLAERRYVDRLSGRAPASTAEMPIDEVATLLRLSGARFGFRDFLASPVPGGALRPDGT